MRNTYFRSLALVALFAGTIAQAADPLPQASERFKTTDVQEVPDFQRHLVPLMGRVGCNGRACHGSFQGQGGFRLSLFGYDFKMDHDGLMERIDLENPLKSYALEKPSMVVEHEGGLKLKPGTWEYNLFAQWLKTGAKPRPAEPADLSRLEVTPSEIRFAKTGEKIQLRAVAIWEDGSREDVTCLTRFVTNDPAVAEVSPEGVVTGVDAGDTHVVAFYDNGIVPVPVLRPYSERTGEKFPQVAATTKVDELVISKLAKLGAVPSDVCADEEFLRRVSLDIAGTLPSSNEVRAFLSDSASDKRARKVEELLATPAYAARWTTMLCDITGNNDTQLNNITAARGRASQEWYDWIYKRVAENTPYDQLMEGIILAVSRNPGESYYDYCVRTSKMYGKNPTASFAEQPGLTYFWGRQNFDQPEERAIGFAYAFMGIRIQCAQCHKHPFDEWTQEDFTQFQAFFDRVRFGKTAPTSNTLTRAQDQEDLQKVLADIGMTGKKTGADRRELEAKARDGQVVPASDLGILAATRTVDKKAKKEGRQVAGKGTKVARLLKSEELINVGAIDDPRKPVMEWLRNPENRLFARAFVNRVWAQYFHRGIVEPTDDLSLANPPSNEPLLDYLADGFVKSGYDMKWLHRTIVSSDTYQRSWRPNETNRLDERNFSRAIPRRLPAEVAVDAVKCATAGSSANLAMRDQLDGRMVVYPGTGNRNTGGPYALNVFGRSLRENNCDCERSAEPSLLQTLYLRNDGDTLAAIDRRDGWLAETAKTMKVPFSAQAGEPESGDRSERKRLKETYDRRVAALKEQAKAAEAAGDKKELQKAERQLAAAKARYAGMLKGAASDKAEARSENAGAASKGNALKISEAESASMVEEAYLRVLSRFPSPDESKIAVEAIQNASDPMNGLRDVLWALLNTKEFIVNH
ncbi:hypothetical protein Pan44_30900 [Caulifigura coniformis]|uniref:BIG2 domain-containing protein n=1 Tax=Caulifigura coniformis TaxID=2527983 RepID=A0A517SFZ7_9PLAN|nr:DUF1549 and DUF1553 domain-containing protein [Caulifigura coniformis]QDT55049.1 hypothetical protein Pan44_30900 [Caulifigura coniformis]